jgi:hypothetical protein
LYQEIQGYISFEYEKDSESFGIYLKLENFNKKVTCTFTLLNIKFTKNISDAFTIKWKEVNECSSFGFSQFIDFHDFINENYLYEDNYVARIIAKIDL